MNDSSQTILILSDPHYAGAEERLRTNFETQGINKPLVRLLVRVWRRIIWLDDPFAHNYHLDQLIAEPRQPDLVVANGDYSCDSAFIGLSDPPSRASARECLGKLRERFGDRLHALMGDHELGKSSLAGNIGGLRLESLRAAADDLKIRRSWEYRSHNHVLIGVTSSLWALDVYKHDALPEEAADWERIRAEHVEETRKIFERVREGERIILFCHDPTALTFLGQEPFVQKRLHQIDRTVLGHLHTPLIFRTARMLAGLPVIHFMGKGIRRITRGLNRARTWRPFKPLLCPSLAGCQLLKDGSYYTAALKPNAPAIFKRHALPWRQ